MFNKEIIQFGRIAFRPTTEADLDYVMKIERAGENAVFIRQWFLEQHQSAILDNNMAHLMVQRARLRSGPKLPMWACGQMDRSGKRSILALMPTIVSFLLDVLTTIRSSLLM